MGIFEVNGQTIAKTSLNDYLVKLQYDIAKIFPDLQHLTCE